MIELAGLGPAQLGGMMLADLGADVIRIDRAGDVPTTPPEAPSTELLGRGRRSVALDLKEQEGVALALGLLDTADVLVDPYRPGVAERLGLGPEIVMARNPRLVFARMTGWGQDGPLAHAAGHDINYIALAGALHPIGDPDRPPPVPLNLLADFGGGGLLLVVGVLAALHERVTSGRGQVVDVAMVDGVATLLTSIFQLMAGGDWHPDRGTNWLQGAAPWYRSYRTADGGFVTVGSLEAKFYARMLERLGIEPDDWPQWDRARWPALAEVLEREFASRKMADWRELLEGTDACFAPVLTLEEAPSHAHLAARGTYVEHGGFIQPAPAPRFERTPGAIAASPPWPGEDTFDVLAEIGVDEERWRELARAGVVAATRVAA